MMKPVRVTALALAAGSLTFAAAKPASDPLDALFFAAISAPATLSYTGVVETVRLGSHAAQASVYRVDHRAPNLTRRVYTAPSDLSGDSVVSESDLTFSIDSRRHRIVETRTGMLDDSVAVRANDALLRENYQAVGKGSESFDGRRVIDLALVNRYSHRTTMLVRIDAANKLCLDKEEFGPGGALVSEMRFEEVRYTASIPAADFALPPHYELVHGARFEGAPESPDRAVIGAGFAARLPRALPDGFSPVEGRLVELRGVRTVHLLYSDGIRTVSLFQDAQASTLESTGLKSQAIRVGGHAAEYAEDGPMDLLAWSDGPLHYTLVGEVGLVDLPHLAASIAK